MRQFVMFSSQACEFSLLRFIVYQDVQGAHFGIFAPRKLRFSRTDQEVLQASLCRLMQFLVIHRATLKCHLFSAGCGLFL